MNHTKPPAEHELSLLPVNHIKQPAEHELQSLQSKLYLPDPWLGFTADTYLLRHKPFTGGLLHELPGSNMAPSTPYRGLRQDI